MWFCCNRYVSFLTCTPKKIYSVQFGSSCVSLTFDTRCRSSKRLVQRELLMDTDQDRPGLLNMSHIAYERKWTCGLISVIILHVCAREDSIFIWKHHITLHANLADMLPTIVLVQYLPHSYTCWLVYCAGAFFLFLLVLCTVNVRGTVSVIIQNI